MDGLTFVNNIILLSSPDLDGLGAGRKGRDPIAFAQIVRFISAAKGVTWEYSEGKQT